MLVMQKKLPIDVASFNVMMTQNYVYVDKTRYIYDLITAGRFYFLSRPRRFGKSLLISTLQELFLGNKDLFKGLWISQQTDSAWPVHPVIHFDFSLIAHRTPDGLITGLHERVDALAREYHIVLQETTFEG